MSVTSEQHLAKLNLKYESPASHPWVTRLLRSGAIESPASRWKMRVPREAKLSRDDRPLLHHGLDISNTCSHAKNRNDPILITWSKVALHEDAFFALPSWEAGDCSHLPPMAHRVCDNVPMNIGQNRSILVNKQAIGLDCEFKWNGCRSTGTVGWLSASEGVNTWKGDPRWIPSDWFHFHS